MPSIRTTNLPTEIPTPKPSTPNSSSEPTFAVSQLPSSSPSSFPSSRPINTWTQIGNNMEAIISEEDDKEGITANRGFGSNVVISKNGKVVAASSNRWYDLIRVHQFDKINQEWIQMGQSDIQLDTFYYSNSIDLSNDGL